MQMSEPGTKKKILKVVEQLPDDATIEEAIERLYFLAKVEKGIREADAGLTVSHEEAKNSSVGRASASQAPPPSSRNSLKTLHLTALPRVGTLSVLSV